MQQIKTCLKIAFTSCISLLSFLGCGEELSDKLVIGTYKGSYAGGTETFIVRPDGSFKQTFYKDNVEVYSTEGKWEIVDHKDVRFSPFIQAVDILGQRGGEPGRFSVARGHWDDIHSSIVFSDDNEYWIVKQK